jgi:hypothetical protein
MSKVITVSRNYPSYHPKAGTPTLFVERILVGMVHSELISMSRCAELARGVGINNLGINEIRRFNLSLKHHTIRAGERIKTGDKISLRYWGDDVNPKSGRKGPYHSKQVTIAHDDVEVVCYPFEINWSNIFLNNKHHGTIFKPDNMSAYLGDGFDNFQDFINWFILTKKLQETKIFKGQLICWNPYLKY